MLKEKLIIIDPDISLREEAISLAGDLLLLDNAIDDEYIDSMHKRDKELSVYMGNGLALPHGKEEAKKYIKKTAISLIVLKNPIKWGDEEVSIVIGLCAKNDEQMLILSKIAIMFSDKHVIKKIKKCKDKKEIIKLFEGCL